MDNTKEDKDLNGKLDRAKEVNMQLRALLRVENAETSALRLQLRAQTSNQTDLMRALKYESTRIKHLPRTWVLSVMLHFVLVLQFWAQFKAVPFLLNLVVFFLQWKRLYVNSFHSSGTLSAIVLVTTFYFYYGSAHRPFSTSMISQKL